ncbi:hypothetical protein BN11_120019 [Nostocoides australiense Ben110]|uniref:Uncharacterized protein n=1 Tax=Nostocoides australiense Ben110 TaxID=1193182 RepID=W6JTX0_9MICO|nr:hypothetical protein BN11_120019 [Tetrasphaera australiensis Ben110]
MSTANTLLALLEPEAQHGYTLKQRYDAYFALRRPLAFGRCMPRWVASSGTGSPSSPRSSRAPGRSGASIGSPPTGSPGSMSGC